MAKELRAPKSLPNKRDKKCFTTFINNSVSIKICSKNTDQYFIKRSRFFTVIRAILNKNYAILNKNMNKE